MLEDGVCLNDMFTQVTECRISLGAVGGGSMQQSHFLLLEFKQLVEASLALPDARHDDTVSGLTGPIQIQVA